MGHGWAAYVSAKVNGRMLAGSLAALGAGIAGVRTPRKGERYSTAVDRLLGDDNRTSLFHESESEIDL